MKGLIRSALFAASAALPLSAVRRPLLLPFYHLVSDEDVPHVKHLYRFRTIAEFKRDLESIARRFKPLRLDEVPDKPGFHLSFDDGLREVHDIVAPILKQMGIPATFFLNTAFLDNREMMFKNKASLVVERLGRRDVLATKYTHRLTLENLGVDFREYLARRRPYLDTEQVRKLIADGFTIGAHSVDHPPYSEISVEEQLRQTIESMEELAKRFGLGYRVFAFPFSDRGVTRRYFDEIFNKNIIQLSFGGDGFTREANYPRNLQRVWMEGHALSAERKVKADWLKYCGLCVLGRGATRRS